MSWCVFGKIFLARSLVAQRLKHMPVMQETQVWSLGREDPLEKEMAVHSSILAWRISWREEPGRLQSKGSQRVRHSWVTSLFFYNEEIVLSGIKCVVETRWAFLVAQMVQNLPAMQETGFDPWVRKIPWRREWQPTPLAWRIPWTEKPGRLQSMHGVTNRHC